MAADVVSFSTGLVARAGAVMAAAPSTYASRVLGTGGGPLIMSLDGSRVVQLPLPDVGDWARLYWRRETHREDVRAFRRTRSTEPEWLRPYVDVGWSALPEDLYDAAYPILTASAFLMAPVTPAAGEPAGLEPALVLAFLGAPMVSATRSGYMVGGYDVRLKLKGLKAYPASSPSPSQPTPVPPPAPGFVNCSAHADGYVLIVGSGEPLPAPVPLSPLPAPFLDYSGSDPGFPELSVASPTTISDPTGLLADFVGYGTEVGVVFGSYPGNGPAGSGDEYGWVYGKVIAHDGTVATFEDDVLPASGVGRGLEWITGWGVFLDVLEWAPVAGADEYEVVVSWDFGGENVAWSKTVPGTSAVWDYDDVYDDVLYWRVRAVQNGVGGFWSEARQGHFTKPQPAQDVVVGVCQEWLNETYGPTLEARRPAGSDYFAEFGHALRILAADGTTVLWHNPYNGQTFYGDVLVPAANTGGYPDLAGSYFVQVRQLNLSGAGPWSDPFAFVADYVHPPVAPQPAFPGICPGAGFLISYTQSSQAYMSGAVVEGNGYSRNFRAQGAVWTKEGPGASVLLTSYATLDAVAGVGNPGGKTALLLEGNYGDHSIFWNQYQTRHQGMRVFRAADVGTWWGVRYLNVVPGQFDLELWKSEGGVETLVDQATLPAANYVPQAILFVRGDEVSVRPDVLGEEPPVWSYTGLNALAGQGTKVGYHARLGDYGQETVYDTSRQAIFAGFNLTGF